MENHQLTAQAIRSEDSPSHYSQRTSQYIASPLISATISEELLQPLFEELITMYHDFGRLIDDTETKEVNATTECTINNMESFQETLENILQRYGVETFCVEQKTFLASKQRILHVIHTADPTLNRHIAKRVRKGFQYRGRLLSPEVVTVYKTVSKQ